MRMFWVRASSRGQHDCAQVAAVAAAVALHRAPPVIPARPVPGAPAAQTTAIPMLRCEAPVGAMVASGYVRAGAAGLREVDLWLAGAV